MGSAENFDVITVNEGLALISSFGLLDGVAPKTLKSVADERGVLPNVIKKQKSSGLMKLQTNLRGFAAAHPPSGRKG